MKLWRRRSPREASKLNAWPLPDFVPASHRSPWWAWAWLLAVLPVMALQVQDVLLWRQESVSLQAQADWFAQAQLQVGPQAEVGEVAKVAGQPSPDDGWADAADALQLDWGARWLALEQGLGPGVQVMSMEMQGGAWRLQAQTEGLDAALHLTQALTAPSPAWPGLQARLTHMEPGSSASGESYVVVSLQARPAAGGAP